MKRWIILALVCVCAALSTRAQIPVSGNMKDLGVNNATGANTFARFTLKNYGASLPTVTGSNVVVADSKDFHTDTNGNISGVIQGNDTILPASTFYQVCIFNNGLQFRCQNYLITAAAYPSGFNLNSASPITPITPTPTQPTGARSFPFTQTVSATTWTINHNFNDAHPEVQCFDTSGNVLYPDRINAVDGNNIIVTFATAQLGTCNVISAGYLNLMQGVQNVVVTNPVGQQTVAGIGSLNTTGSNNHTGTETFRSLNNIRFADDYVAGDCGAKAMLADADLGVLPGEIWVNQNCGLTWTTAVTLGIGHTLRFIQGGTYTLSNTLTASGTGSGIAGPAPARTAGSGLTLPQVTLQEAGGANLASLVSLSGSLSFFLNIAIDGNKSGNPTGGACLLVNKAGGVHAYGYATQNCKTDSLKVLSTAATRNNESDAFKTGDFLLYASSGDGINCVATNDMFISGNWEIENPGINGIELNDCGAARILHGDIAGSGADGIKCYGTIAGNGCSDNKIQSIQFGLNASHDINIQGWDSVGGNIAAQQNLIEGNTFIGTVTATDNVNPSILIQDSTLNTVMGNTMNSNGSHRWKWLIQMLAVNESAGGGNDIIMGNTGFGTAGTGPGNPMGGVAALSNNVILGNTMFGFPVASQGLVFANNTAINFYDNAGTSQQIFKLDNSNNAVIYGHPTAQAIYFQPNPGGNTSFQLTATGIANTTGLQLFNTTTTCTTAATINTPCTTAAITLPVAYADTAYRISCTPYGPTQFPQLQTITKSNTSFTITLNNLTAAAASYSSFDCTVAHN